MHDIFADITIVLVISTIIAIFFRLLKQPPILAYILAGFLIGPLGLLDLHSPETLTSFSEIGITLLLFLLGLELKLEELRSVGKVALLTGIGQIVITSAVGYVFAILLGFSAIASVYIAIGLTFSSTIVIVKLLSDKKALNNLYGKISIGFLLVQDFFAIIALVVLACLDANSASEMGPFVNVLFILLKAAVLFVVIVYMSQVIFPKIVHLISKSRELLFIFSISWALGLSALISSEYVGLSIEIGGFLAGLALANTKESFQIVTKVQSLRDFFITIFFVTLGLSLAIDNVVAIIVPGLLLSIFVLVGNPLIVMGIMGTMGFRKRTSFMAGLTVAQISEFSLIVAFLGRKLGHLSDNVISLMTFVAIITFTLSTYAILYNEKLFKLLSPYLNIFERKDAKGKRMKNTQMKNHVVVAGAHRIGMSVLKNLEKIKEDVLVVDFNPAIADQLEQQGFKYIFGDIAEPDMQEAANLYQARILMSTIPDLEDNLLLINNLRAHNSKVKIIIAVHHHTKEIEDLYAAGADYVVLPHMLMGDTLGKIIRNEKYETLERITNRQQKTIDKLAELT